MEPGIFLERSSQLSPLPMPFSLPRRLHICFPSLSRSNAETASFGFNFTKDMDSKSSYGPLPEHEDATSLEEKSETKLYPSHTQITSRRPFQAFSLLVLFAFGALAGTTITYMLASTRSPGERWHHCGSSVAEARQNGCEFEPMMNGWTAPECRFPELAEEYLEEGNFHFFADRFGYEEIPLDIYRRGEHLEIFTTTDHHYTHCAYMWRLQGIALANDAHIDKRSLDESHTAHCAQMLLTPHNLDRPESLGNGTRLPSNIKVGFVSCRVSR